MKDGATVYVLLEIDQLRPDTDQAPPEPDKTDDQTELVAVLRKQLAAERRANEEYRRIIVGLVQRIPELAAPPACAQEAEDVAESASVGSDGPESPQASTEWQTETSQAGESPERVPWWRRILGR